MIDRVEVSIIEEVQPRWLSFLNKQADVSWLVPFDFVNIAAPNGKLAPFLAKQECRLYRTLASDMTLYYFNMEDAARRWLHAGESGAASGDRAGDRCRPGDPAVLARAGRSRAFQPDAQHRWL